MTWGNHSRPIDRGEEVTWQRVGRPIVCAISTVDLHLKLMDTRGLNEGSLIILISTVDRESYNGRD